VANRPEILTNPFKLSTDLISLLSKAGARKEKSKKAQKSASGSTEVEEKRVKLTRFA
jgi:hypothetical protein